MILSYANYVLCIMQYHYMRKEIIYSNYMRKKVIYYNYKRRKIRYNK